MMKFTVTMKDPDTLHDAIGDAVRNELALMENIDDDEKEAIEDVRREKIDKVCQQWFRYGEYLEVEIDTEAKTIRVVPTA